jgi:hypothetical protein
MVHLSSEHALERHFSRPSIFHRQTVSIYLSHIRAIVLSSFVTFTTLHPKATYQFSYTISTITSSCTILYHITLGVSYTAVASQFAVGKSTVNNIIGQVAEAICIYLTKKFIRFSNTEEALQSMQFWQNQVQIHGIVACIDTSHIAISRPRQSSEGYFNLKRLLQSEHSR